jgi:hypothetical protein
MKVFIWQYASNVTDNYHSSGGLVIFAESLSDALSALGTKLESVKADSWCDFDPTACSAYTKGPDVTFDVGPDAPSMVLIFPDAGCC